MIHEAVITIDFVKYELVSNEQSNKTAGCCQGCELRAYCDNHSDFHVFCLSCTPYLMTWRKVKKEAQE